MRRLPTYILLWVAVTASFDSSLIPAAYGQEKPAVFTQPQPPKIKPPTTVRIDPSSEIPLLPEKFTWKVSNILSGKTTSSGPVYVYRIVDGRASRIGSITAGTVIKLDAATRVGNAFFYLIPWDNVTMLAGQDTQTNIGRAWIGGYNLTAENTPSVQ